MAYFFLAGAFLCNGAANVLLKLAAAKQFSFDGIMRGEFTAATMYVAGAAVLFGFNLVLYLFALEKIPLSVGYSVMIGMTFLITTSASFFLGEKINLLHASGMALILVGIFLVVRFAGT